MASKMLVFGGVGDLVRQDQFGPQNVFLILLKPSRVSFEHACRFRLAARPKEGVAMKKCMVFLVALFLTGATAYATSIPVTNYSFEQPGDGKIIGWDMANGAYYYSTGAPAEVPGWSSDWWTMDSGVESDWPGSTEGVWSGFLMSVDPSIWNLTSHVIAAGEVFTLQVDARENWSTIPGFADLLLILYYDDAAGRPWAAATFIYDMPETWQTYSLSFAADTFPYLIGHKIGIEIVNISMLGPTECYVGIDNVRLDVNGGNVIPEPASFLLLGSGLVGLIGYGWRRRKR
jgi:hypothetical protein